jgi:uncharacterized protein (TIGR00266 family)
VRVQVQTRHGPSYPVARLLLAGGEPVKVESGAMLATSYGVAVETRTSGGTLRSLARAARGGDTPLISTYTAPQQGGWVDTAPRLPGDLHTVELDGSTGWCISRACWLASAAGVHLDTGWGGFGSLFGGEGGFLVHASGHGPVVVSCYGALDVFTLQQGELITVDTGHVVAYADVVQSRVRPVSLGVTQSMKSGAGLVFDFAGPAQVLTQTRNPRGLIGWLHANGLASRA